MRLLAQVVPFRPDPTGLPGSAALQHMTNGVGFWALIFALAGMLIGAGAWAVGNHSQNYHQAFNGRRAVLVSGLAALIVGAAPALVNFFYSAGRAVNGQ